MRTTDNILDGRKMSYCAVHFCVISIAVCLFASEYGSVRTVFSGESGKSILGLFLTVALVHAVKAARLYFLLYGAGIPADEYLKTYCKVTPVSILFPFKLGELFRMYCYGRLVGNQIRGIMVVLLDRFMDTTALVSLILLGHIGQRMPFVPVAYAFILFLLSVLLLYAAFPGIHRYWKRQLLDARATERTVRSLRMLESVAAVYGEASSLAKGKGILVYMMSLAAWGMEIGSLAFQDVAGGNGMGDAMMDYLTAAMGGGSSARLDRFAVLSIGFLLVLYAVMKLKGLAGGGKR